MAGVKVTDLPILSAADLADIFYVVDASGVQSKQVDLATIAAALSTALPYVHLKGTAFGGQGQVTGDIEIDQAAGGVITLRFGNGDIIALGVDYGGYSAISFYDATANETCYLFLRGGDLRLENVDTAQGTGSLIATINLLINQKVNYSLDTNPTMANPSTTDGGKDISLWNGDVYMSNGLNGNTGGKCWTPIPQHYFSDSCSYLQSGTNPPQVQATFETQVGGMVTKTITYVSTGLYHITYDVGVNTYFLPSASSQVKVMVTNGNTGNSIVNAYVNTPTISTIEVSIETRNALTGNLANGLLSNTFIDVYWYN